jgi:hypothetical protein
MNQERSQRRTQGRAFEDIKCWRGAAIAAGRLTAAPIFLGARPADAGAFRRPEFRKRVAWLDFRHRTSLGTLGQVAVGGKGGAGSRPGHDNDLLVGLVACVVGGGEAGNRRRLAAADRHLGVAVQFECSAPVVDCRQTAALGPWREVAIDQPPSASSAPPLMLQPAVQLGYSRLPLSFSIAASSDSALTISRR